MRVRVALGTPKKGGSRPYGVCSGNLTDACSNGPKLHHPRWAGALGLQLVLGSSGFALWWLRHLRGRRELPESESKPQGSLWTLWTPRHPRWCTFSAPMRRVRHYSQRGHYPRFGHDRDLRTTPPGSFKNGTGERDIIPSSWQVVMLGAVGNLTGMRRGLLWQT